MGATSGGAVSVALATYRGASFLLPQLESLARQTHEPAEVVICDDGSDDGTEAVVRGFADRAPFPVLYRRNERRLGYKRNFMRAAGLCRGELVAFCDQDDVWEGRKLETMVRAFEDPRVLLAYHDATVVDEAGRPVGELYRSAGEARRFEPLAMDPWSLVLGFLQVFRRELTTHDGLQPASLDPYRPGEPLAHDQWYLFLASVLGSVARVPEALARYRQHGRNRFGWRGRPQREHDPAYVPLRASFAAAADNRVELLGRLEGAVEGERKERVGEAAAFYRALARRLRERWVVYSAPAAGDRMGAVRDLLAQGAYARPGGADSFGWRGLLVDAVLGVPAGPGAARLLGW